MPRDSKPNIHAVVTKLVYLLFYSVLHCCVFYCVSYCVFYCVSYCVSYCVIALSKNAGCVIFYYEGSYFYYLSKSGSDFYLATAIFSV